MRGLSSIATVLVLAGACAAPTTGLSCTDRGASTGVGVTVSRDLAADLDELTLRVCLPSGCTDQRVELSPGEATADGTLVGFVEVAGMEAGKVTVSGAARVDGRTRTLVERTVQAVPTYPNGTACPPVGVQVQISVGGDGIR